MLSNVPDALWSVLECPQCGEGFDRGGQNLRCAACGTEFRQSPTGSLDLRLQRDKSQAVEFTLDARYVLPDFDFGALEPAADPEVDHSGILTPWHISSELLSYFPRALSASSFALDLGCGAGLHRSVCEHAGFTWIGLDYSASEAPILGDAHALPLNSESMEFVLSIAVLEHIEFPWLALRRCFAS